MEENIELPKLNKENNSSIIKQTTNEEKKKTFGSTIKEIHKYITNTGLKGLAKLTIELLLIAVLILCFKLPFQLVIELGPSVFAAINTSAEDVMEKIWIISLNVGYFIFGISYYIKIITDRYYNINDKVTK